MSAVTVLLCVSLATSLYLEDVENFREGLENFKKFIDKTKTVEESYPEVLKGETEEYDFVIIGAGAAGAVVANRLSEVPYWKILVLLEAGGEENEFTQVPSLFLMMEESPYSWGFQTTPQKHWCKEMPENRCVIPAGKILGGSTSINAMNYIRGNRRDYDLWGNHWCYESVLPYFIKSENCNLQYFDEFYHGWGGGINVENPPYLTELSISILKAAKELNINIVDYNGRQQSGIAISQVATRFGNRHSTNQGYLQPIKNRPNLTIKTGSFTTELVAGGVRYINQGRIHTAKVKKEVVLSAGAVKTPQILMLSGVGRKEDLEKLQIPVLQDLEVGFNLKDHVGFTGLEYIYNSSRSTGDEVLEYFHGLGPLSSTGIETIAFISTDNSSYPNIELIFFRTDNSLTVIVVPTHPKSTGTIKLKDKDPFHHPLVDSNLLCDSDDVEVLISGIRKGVQFLETMEGLGGRINKKPVRGCVSFEWGSEEYWRCAVGYSSMSMKHLTGTSRMGVVVDEELRVLGVGGLRVVDASVIPVSITGHTMAATVMVGERGADFIKAAWSYY